MTGCPATGVLERFLDDALPSAEAGAVSAHVDGCPRCQQTLESLTKAPLSSVVTSSPARTSTAAPAHPPSESGALFLSRLKVSPPTGGTAVPARGRSGRGDLPRPTVPGYEILGELGRGGMGVVYKARQLRLDRLVALKMILAGSHAASTELDRFRQEAAAIAQLRHPHIVQIYDVGEVGGTPYFALEYVDGGSLADWLRGDPQPLYPSLRLIETLARAVQHAHDHALVHRDLKPANVLIYRSQNAECRTPQQMQNAECRMQNERQEEERQMTVGGEAADGWGSAVEEKRDGGAGAGTAVHSAFCILHSAFCPKITDFGLAKRVGEASDRTRTGELVGTPSYMAPEQAAGAARPVGPAADVYALGAILYEMLTGRPPFKGATALDTALQVLHEEPVRPSSLRPGLPSDVETICLKCLAKDPGRRYPSAAALADDLHRFCQGRPITARPIGPLERGWKWARRKPVVAGLMAGMVLVGLLGFAGVTWQWREAAQARDVALEEKLEKEEQRIEAEEARADAVAAQQKEAAQRLRVRTALYSSRIAQSQLAWKVNDYSGALQALAKCRPASPAEERRGWEWYYLEGLYHSYLFSFRHDQPGAGGSAAYSPDGRRVAAVVGGEPGDETARTSELRVWDATTGTVLLTRPVDGTWHRLAFAPRDGRLALGGTDGRVAVWDLAAGKEVVRYRPHEAAVACIAFSPDGRRVATAGWDQVVHLWDAATGRPIRTWRGHDGRVQSVSFHPDGSRVASGSWDGKIRLWDVGRDDPVDTWTGHKGAVYEVAFSPDGRQLVSAGRNGTLRIWDVENARTVQTLSGGVGAVLCVGWSPDGRYIGYGGGDATVRVWDVEAGVERMVFRGHQAAVEGVGFSPDGQRLVSCSPAAGLVKVWDLTRHPEYATFARTRADVEAVAFDPDAGRVVTVAVGGKVQSWEAGTGVLREERAVPIAPDAISPGATAALDPRGRLVAGRWADDPRVVKVWDVATGAERAVCRGHGAKVVCVRFSDDGGLLATAACEAVTAPGRIGSQTADRGRHEIAVWEAATGRQQTLWRGVGRIFTLAFRPDGRGLAWGGEDGAVGLADWTTGRPVVATDRKHRGNVLAVAFTPDGHQLATAGTEDRTVKVWRVEGDGDRPRLHLRGAVPAPVAVCDLAFSPNGGRLAAVTRDLVKLWDVEGRQEVLTLRGAPQRHFDAPFNPRVLFSSDGGLLAATNWDESLSLWAGEEIDDGSADVRQVRRRRAADARAMAWHIEEAEHCLDHKNLPAARFHLDRIRAADLAPPLAARLAQVRDRLAAPAK